MGNSLLFGGSESEDDLWMEAAGFILQFFCVLFDRCREFVLGPG